MYIKMAEKMAADGENNKSGFKQCIGVIEKKVRNLEKRKAKLDSYRDLAATGEELNKDQLEAVAQYDVVVKNLEFAHDMQKQFVALNSEADKQLKKQLKRERVEKQQQECSRLREVLLLQNVLNSLPADSTRDDLVNGKFPALVLSREELAVLDDFYQLIVPARNADENFEDQLSSASEHMQFYLEGVDKKATSSASYKQIRELIGKIHASGYLSDPSVNSSSAELSSHAVPTSEQVLENGSESEQIDSSESGRELAASCSSSVSAADPPTPAPSPATTAVPVYSGAEEESVRGAGGLPTDLSYCTSSHQHWTSHNQSAVAAVLQGGRGAQAAAMGTSCLPAVSPVLHSQQQQLANAADTRYNSFYADGSAGVVASSGGYGGHRPISDVVPSMHTGQRPINEIVSSMQGASFNFLQESQIELDMDPAIVAVMPVSQSSLAAVSSSAAYSHAHVTAAAPTSVPHSLQQQQLLQLQQQQRAGVHQSSLFTEQDDNMYRHQQLLQQQQQLAQLHQQQQVFPGSQQDERFSVEQAYSSQELRDPTVQQQGSHIAGQYSRYLDQSQPFHSSQQISVNTAGGPVPHSINSTGPEAYNNITPTVTGSSRTELSYQQQVSHDQPKAATPVSSVGMTGPMSQPTAAVGTAGSRATAAQQLNEAAANNSSQSISQFAPSSSDMAGQFRAGNAGVYSDSSDYNGGGDAVTGSRGGAGFNSNRGAGGRAPPRDQQYIPPSQRGGGVMSGGGKMPGSGGQYNGGSRGGGGGYSNGGGYNMGGGGRGGAPGGYSRGGPPRGGAGGGGYHGMNAPSQRGGGGPPRSMAASGPAGLGMQRGPRPPMMQHNA